MMVISVTAFIKKADLIRLPTYIDQCPIVEGLLKNNSTTDLLSEFDMTTTEQSFMDFTTTESSIALALMDDDG